MKCEQEKKLVTRFKSGDADAFGMLFKLYAPKLGSFCLGLVSKEDAENIVQDVFLKLWETRKKIDPSQNFGMYTMTIARNLIYDMFRRGSVDILLYSAIIFTVLLIFAAKIVIVPCISIYDSPYDNVLSYPNTFFSSAFFASILYRSFDSILNRSVCWNSIWAL